MKHNESHTSIILNSYLPSPILENLNKLEKRQYLKIKNSMGDGGDNVMCQY